MIASPFCVAAPTLPGHSREAAIVRLALRTHGCLATVDVGFWSWRSSFLPRLFGSLRKCGRSFSAIFRLLQQRSVTLPDCSPRTAERNAAARPGAGGAGRARHGGPAR